MKSVREIKKSIELCSKGISVEESDCMQCPYDSSEDCLKEQGADMLELITHCEYLEDELSLMAARKSRAYAEGQNSILSKLQAMLETIPTKWISVEERLPDNDVPVLVSSERNAGNGKVYNVVFTAFHTDGTTHTEDSEYGWDYDYLGMKYCEETDDYIIPEAWWEDVHFGEEFSIIPDYVRITHWMPLPKPWKANQKE